MKVLSFLVTLHGVGYFIQSILELYRGTELRIGFQEISSSYNIVGVILGTWLIVTGMGLWYRKRYAYNSTIIAYSMLIIYGIVTLVYILLTQPIISDILVPMVIVAITLGIFFIVIRYVQKNIHEFMSN